jgi:hypothetical protein
MNVYEKSRVALRGSSRRSAVSGAAQARGSALERSEAPGWLWLAVRILGALSVLAVGAVHLHQFYVLYSSIPTIGTLFVLNFAGATAIGIGLLAPVEHVLGRRSAPVLGLLALAGAGLAATSFVFLLVSEHTPLFGFMEPGYDPAAILASRVAEAVTVLALGSFLGARFALRKPARSW